MTEIPDPPVYLGRTDVAGASTWFDPDAVYTRFLSLFAGDETAPDPLNRLDWLNPLDPRFTKALDQTRSLGTLVYQGEPITTIAQQRYGTTSAWFLIVVFNGFMHPDEIPRGMEIEVPDLEGFKAAWQAASQKQTRTIIF